MNESATGLPPAGWYPDAADSSSRRWWDGAAWTAHVAPLAPVSQGTADNAIALLERPADMSSQDFALIAGGYTPKPTETASYHATEPVWLGSPQTLPGWFIAVSPLWYAGVGILVGIIGRLIFPGAEQSVAAAPSLIAFLLILVGLAREDRKRMHARGYRPVATGWVLIPLVYLILRTVRTGRSGAAMLVVYLVLQLAFLALVVVLAIAIYVTLMNPSIHPGVVQA
jgi:hypothetical protein